MQRKKSDRIENPAAHVDRPADILKAQDLSRREKKEALDNWEEDARRLSVATDEGMGGGEPSRLTEVADAKNALDAPAPRRRPSPTKTG